MGSSTSRSCARACDTERDIPLSISVSLLYLFFEQSRTDPVIVDVVAPPFSIPTFVASSVSDNLADVEVLKLQVLRCSSFDESSGVTSLACAGSASDDNVGEGACRSWCGCGCVAAGGRCCHDLLVCWKGVREMR